MRKKPVRLALPHSCSESLQNMNKTAGGYFCPACETEVVDYRDFSDADMLASLQIRAGKSCGIFREDQINRQIYPAGERTCTSFAHTWKALSLLAGLSLSPKAGELIAQTPQKIAVTEAGKPNIKNQIRPADKPVRYLAGTVRSGHDDMPIKNVRVRFEEGGKSVRTDKNGRFKIILPEDIAVEYVTVAVSTRRDYKPFHKKIKVAALPAERLSVELWEKREGVIMGNPRAFF